MTLEEAYSILDDHEADAIGYGVCSENRHKAIIAAAICKAELVAKKQAQQAETARQELVRQRAAHNADPNARHGVMVPQELGPNPKQAYGDKKLPLHRVPPAAVAYAALGLKDGATKYGPFNWRDQPVELLTYYAACQRHMMAWFDGEEIDPDSSNPHLAHAIACLAIMVDAITSGNAIDNRPKPSPYRMPVAP